MMSVSEFFSSDPEPPWIVDVATDLESYTDIHTQDEASSSTTSTASVVSTTDLDYRAVMDMEIDIPSSSSVSRIDRVVAHLFTLREIESVRPFRIEDGFKGATGAVGRRAAGRSKASRKRKFSQIK